MIKYTNRDKLILDGNLNVAQLAEAFASIAATYDGAGTPIAIWIGVRNGEMTVAIDWADGDFDSHVLRDGVVSWD